MSNLHSFHVDPYADHCGTTLKGYVILSYAEMVELFGQPPESDEYKVSSEWIFSDTDGNVYTIYDWKATNLYDASYPSVEQFRKCGKYEFNVGSNANADRFIYWIKDQLHRSLAS